MRIKLLPLEERPRERLEKQGESALSSAEIIAVILGSGTKGKSVLSLSQEIISHFGSLKNLADASIIELCQFKGLGKAKAIQLKAALGLGLRLCSEIRPKKFPVYSAHQAYDLVRDRLADQKKEIFGVILQDVRGNAYKWDEISIGTLTQTIVHPREVFHSAIRHRAASLILVHNHPSGDLSPSKEDIDITRILVEAGQLIGIPVNDHIIVGSYGFISFVEKGISLL